MLPHQLLDDLEDLSGSPVVENLPAYAVDRGLVPGLGTKTPYTAGQVSVCITVTEASESESPCSASREASTVRSPGNRTRE